jgi:hypothetical protein
MYIVCSPIKLIFKVKGLLSIHAYFVINNAHPHLAQNCQQSDTIM